MIIQEYDPNKLSKFNSVDPETNKRKYQPHRHIRQLLNNSVIEFLDFQEDHIMIYKVCEDFVVIPELSADPIIRIEINYDKEYDVQFFNYIYTDSQTTRVTSTPTKLNIFKRYELM